MTDNSTTHWRIALEKERISHTELALLFDLHSEILSAQHAIHDLLPPFNPSVDVTRIAAGKSILVYDALAVDWDLFRHLWQQVDEIMRKHSDDWPREAIPIVSPETVHGWFDGELLANEPLDFLVAAALAPFLWRASEAIRPNLNEEAWWRDYCPACGGKPDFAFLDNDRGARHLVCSRCDGTWLYLRIGCPFCGNKDPQRLAYYPSEDQIYRLYVCEQCQCYLKAIDLRQARHHVVWPVERIATAGLDAAAIQQGYQE